MDKKIGSDGQEDQCEQENTTNEEAELVRVRAVLRDVLAVPLSLGDAVERDRKNPYKTILDRIGAWSPDLRDKAEEAVRGR